MDHMPAGPQYVKRNRCSHERVENDISGELHQTKTYQHTD